MDPVTAIGLASGVVQLADLARTTFSALFQYFEDVRHAPKRSRELRRELESLCDILGDLDHVLASHSAATPFKAPDSLKSAITDFQGMLESMNARVTESRTKGLGRLKWPFTKEENDRYLIRMERYKSTFNAVLNIKTAYHSSTISLITCRYDIGVLVDDSLVKRRREILEWLSVSNYDSRHDELRKTRTENTGLWFVKSDEFTQWMKGDGSSCLLCLGIRKTSTYYLRSSF